MKNLLTTTALVAVSATAAMASNDNFADKLAKVENSWQCQNHFDIDGPEVSANINEFEFCVWYLNNQREAFFRDIHWYGLLPSGDIISTRDYNFSSKNKAEKAIKKAIEVVMSEKIVEVEVTKTVTLEIPVEVVVTNNIVHVIDHIVTETVYVDKEVVKTILKDVDVANIVTKTVTIFVPVVETVYVDREVIKEKIVEVESGDRINALESEVSKLQSDLMVAASKADIDATEIARLGTELATSSAALSTLTSANAVLEATVAGLEETDKVSKEEIAALNVALKAAQDEAMEAATAHANELASLNAQLGLKQGEIDSLASVRDSLESANADLQTRINEAISERDDLQQRLTDAQTAAADYAHMFNQDALDNARQQGYEAAERIARDLASDAAEAAELAQTIAVLNATAPLNEMIDNLETEIQEATVKINGLETNVANAEMRLESVTRVKDRIIEGLNEDLDTAKAERDALQTVLDNTIVEDGISQADVDAAYAEVQANPGDYGLWSVESVDRMIAAKDAEIATIEATLAMAESDLTDAEDRAELAEHEAATLTTRVNELSDQIEGFQTDINAAQTAGNFAGQRGALFQVRAAINVAAGEKVIPISDIPSIEDFASGNVNLRAIIDDMVAALPAGNAPAFEPFTVVDVYGGGAFEVNADNYQEVLGNYNQAYSDAMVALTAAEAEVTRLQGVEAKLTTAMSDLADANTEIGRLTTVASDALSEVTSLESSVDTLTAERDRALKAEATLTASKQKTHDAASQYVTVTADMSEADIINAVWSDGWQDATDALTVLGTLIGYDTISPEVVANLTESARQVNDWKSLQEAIDANATVHFGSYADGVDLSTNTVTSDEFAVSHGSALYANGFTNGEAYSTEVLNENGSGTGAVSTFIIGNSNLGNGVVIFSTNEDVLPLGTSAADIDIEGGYSDGFLSSDRQTTNYVTINTGDTIQVILETGYNADGTIIDLFSGIDSQLEAYVEGYKDGYAKGYDDGYADGYDDGFTDGVASTK